MLVDIQFIADWKKIGEHRQQPIVTPTVKTKVELIMTTRWSKSTRTEQWYSSAKQSPGIRESLG